MISSIAAAILIFTYNSESKISYNFSLKINKYLNLIGGESTIFKF